MRRLLPVLLLFMGVMSLADAASNRLTAKYDDGNTGNRTLTSNYDFLNRLSYITDTVGNTTYHYDLAGRRVGLLYPSGSDITTTFDALGRQAEIIGHGNSTTTRYDLVLAYDLYSNLGHQAETYTHGNLTTRTLALAYDNANRLTSELISTGSGTITNITNTFTYDAGYNRSTKVTVQKIGSGGNTTEANITYHYDAANQLNYYVNTIGSVTTNLTYDHAGNRLSSVNGTANLTYTYDVQNRLSEIDSYNSGYTSYEPVSDYAYDYRGRRAVRGQYGFVEGSSTTENITTSLFDGGNPVREQQYNYVGSSNTTPTTTLSEFIRGSDWGGGVGGILYSLHLSGNTATPSYYHYDGRGDVVAQTNSTGNLTYQTAYDSYGTHGGANGTQTFGSNTDPFQANSKEEDPSGLLDEGRRYRDLATDTFITRDPLGMAGGGPNFYTYVGQNPWTKFDPEGLAQNGPGLEDASGRFIPSQDLLEQERIQKIRDNPTPNPPMTLKDFAVMGIFASAFFLGPEALAAIPEIPASVAVPVMTVATNPVVQQAVPYVIGGTMVAADTYSRTKDGGQAVQDAVGSMFFAWMEGRMYSGGSPSASAEKEKEGATRLAQDAAVNPNAPAPLPLNRPIGASPTQNAALQNDIADAQAAGATDLRVNQQQVNADGQRVGVNRPDLQYTTPDKQRVYKEYDTTKSPRGPDHEERIKANDPDATVNLKTVD